MSNNLTSQPLGNPIMPPPTVTPAEPLSIPELGNFYQHQFAVPANKTSNGRPLANKVVNTVGAFLAFSTKMYYSQQNYELEGIKQLQLQLTPETLNAPQHWQHLRLVSPTVTGCELALRFHPVMLQFSLTGIGFAATHQIYNKIYNIERQLLDGSLVTALCGTLLRMPGSVANSSTPNTRVFCGLSNPDPYVFCLRVASVDNTVENNGLPSFLLNFGVYAHLLHHYYEHTRPTDLDGLVYVGSPPTNDEVDSMNQFIVMYTIFYNSRHEKTDFKEIISNASDGVRKLAQIAIRILQEAVHVPAVALPLRWFTPRVEPGGELLFARHGMFRWTANESNTPLIACNASLFSTQCTTAYERACEVTSLTSFKDGAPTSEQQWATSMDYRVEVSSFCPTGIYNQPYLSKQQQVMLGTTNHQLRKAFTSGAMRQD